jgi:ADP-ribose pyrophosphatase YjhB (NUDIX family)
MEMSWIQRHALMVLLRGETARVKDMCPTDVPANLFSYHLDGLVTGKYIIKSERGVYKLTTKGLKLAGAFSTATLRPTENIKTVVMLYGERDGKVLLFRWSRQPYLGEVTLPYDRMAHGTALSDGVRTALIDKIGSEQPATYMTSLLVKIMHDDELVSHMHALVYQVNCDNITLPFVGRNGEAFFGDMQASDIIDGVGQVVAHLRNRHELSETIWRF